MLPVADVEFPLPGILLLEHRVGVEGAVGFGGWALALTGGWWCIIGCNGRRVSGIIFVGGSGIGDGSGGGGRRRRKAGDTAKGTAQVYFYSRAGAGFGAGFGDGVALGFGVRVDGGDEGVEGGVEGVGWGWLEGHYCQGGFGWTGVGV